MIEPFELQLLFTASGRAVGEIVLRGSLLMTPNGEERVIFESALSQTLNVRYYSVTEECKRLGRETSLP